MKPFLPLLALWLAACGGGGGQSFLPISTVDQAAPSSVQTYCVIGDSFSSDPSKYTTQSWPFLLEQQTGIKVYDAAVGGFTFSLAATNPVINGQTPVQYCITQKPSIVFVMLGINDTAQNALSSELGALESNAATVYSQLKAALPQTQIVIILEQMWNPTANTASLKNADVVAFYRSPGGLLDPITGWGLGAINNIIGLNLYLQGLGAKVIPLNYWQVQQNGGVSADGLHPTQQEEQVMETIIYRGLS